jgi:adenylate cyclase
MADPSDTQATAPRRELAAIMFSDIAGYTAIMGRDEARAMRALAEHRALLRTLLPKFDGRMLGEIGDGTLTSFHSASDAVNCARQAQAALKDSPDLQVRIGIHLGDVLFTDDNAWGDGVNIASRIHALAVPGSICVSATVYDEIRNKPGLVARNLGMKHLKNVSRPIGVYVLSEAADSHDAPTRSVLASPLRRRVALGAVGAIVIVALVYVLATRKPSAPLATTAPAIGPHVIRSIAVLPLDNYSGDPNQQYFADGMTDELTTDLATISQLRVISRGSVMQFKGEHRPPTPQIAKLLNVDAVVEGSVLRVGDKVRITAQLIDAPADKHLWAKSYERDSRDVLALQDEVASAIAKEIEVQLTPNEQARLASAATVNPAAYDAYLKGRYFFNRSSDEDLTKAIAQYEEAIKLDPNFAPAYAGVADAYNWAGWNEGVFTSAEAMTKVKAAAEKAIQLDDNSAEAHAAVAGYKFTYEFDWMGAEREFRRAFELNPSYAYAHDQFAFALEQQGRLDEALAQSRRAIELDPLSPELLAESIWPLAWQGKYDAAKAQARIALDLDPTNYLAQFLIGWVDLEAGKFSDAIPELEKAAATTGAPPYITAYIGYAYGASGDRARALAQIEVLNKRSIHGFVPPFSTAIVYLGMGDRERAMTGLEQAYAAHSQFLGLLKMDKMFTPLHSDPRYKTLLKKLNFEN